MSIEELQEALQLRRDGQAVSLVLRNSIAQALREAILKQLGAARCGDDPPSISMAF